MGTMTGEVREVSIPVAAEEMMQEAPQKHWGRSLGRLLLIGGMGAAASTAGAAFLDPTNTEVGPHEATVTLSMDSALTIDISPLGSIILPQEGTNGFGAQVELGEIPGTDSDDPNQVELFTEADVEEYVQFFSSTESTQDEAISAIARNALGFAPLGGLVTLGLYGLVGRRRWAELWERTHDPIAKRILIGGAVLSLTTSCVAWNQASEDTEGVGIPISSAFDDTGLEGARVTGKPLQNLLNQYGAQAMGYIERNNTFFSEVEHNLVTAFAQERILRPNDNYQLILFETDEHLNFGMATISGRAAELAQVSMFISAGDLTASGTVVENRYIGHLARQLAGVDKRVVVTGNHDSEHTEEALRQHGFTVLNGEIVDINGLTILGDDDPRRSAFGQGIQPEGDETEQDMSERLRDIACEDGSVDILVTHDPDVVAYARDCIRLGLSGHTHQGRGEYLETSGADTVFHLTGDSSGGADHDRPTYGPLRTTARLYLLKVSEETGNPVFYQTISIAPDATVSVEQPVYIEQPDGN